MRLACIGIGSNAIRLLTAGWEAGHLCAIHRERRGTRLFAGLENGALTQVSMRSSVNAVAELSEIARSEGVREIFVFATSAVRDASNGRQFTACAEAAAGAHVEIVSGEEEAVLSYLGASEGGSCGVMDIGGGSTEFTFGEEDDVLGAISLQIGAVRLNGLQPIRSGEDYEATKAYCTRMICEGAAKLLALPKRDYWVGVGGTMTTLGAMHKGEALFDPYGCEGMRIALEDVAEWGERLSRMKLEARMQIVGLMPQRADIIPSGIAILEAAMRCFGVGEIGLSAHGNMDGYLKKKFKEMY